MGETVPEVLSTAESGTQTEGTVSPNTDRPRPVNNIFIFFLLRFKFQENFTSASNLCVLKKGAFALMLFKARDRLQTTNKTLQHDFFSW